MSNHMGTLTPKRIHILQLRAQGLPFKTIAAELKCTTKTVDYHLRWMTAYFGARNPLHLIYLATKQGII